MSLRWRNWKTHQVQGLAGAIPWEFKSPSQHPNKYNFGNCVWGRLEFHPMGNQPKAGKSLLQHQDGT